MIKKLLSLILLVGILGSCDNEPKMSEQEENAIENQLQADQKAMDSLEAAILSQMDEVNLDSLEEAE
jgi:hypothetical protein